MKRIKTSSDVHHTLSIRHSYFTLYTQVFIYQIRIPMYGFLLYQQLNLHSMLWHNLSITFKISTIFPLTIIQFSLSGENGYLISFLQNHPEVINFYCLHKTQYSHVIEPVTFVTLWRDFNNKIIAREAHKTSQNSCSLQQYLQSHYCIVFYTHPMKLYVLASHASSFLVKLITKIDS